MVAVRADAQVSVIVMFIVNGDLGFELNVQLSFL